MDKSVCLYLAASLHTAVDLDSIIDTRELKGEGIIRDTHITIVYDPSMTLSRQSILSDVSESLGNDFSVFDEFMKDSYKFKVNDVCYLDSFNGEDSSHLVLRLKEDNELHKMLSIIHSAIIDKYSIEETYPIYKPHVTLAELEIGSADKYLDNSVLLKVLEDSKIGFEDLVLSESIEDDKYAHWNITTHHALTRFFRETRI